jgi:hypothetical protein
MIGLGAMTAPGANDESARADAAASRNGFAKKLARGSPTCNDNDGKAL